MNRETIFTKVREILAQILEIRPEAIRGESSLLDDLGLESIDLIDISAQISRVFEVPLMDASVLNLSALLEDECMLEEGRLTPTGVQCLQNQCFFYDFEALRAGIPLLDLLGQIRVDHIVGYIHRAQAKGKSY
jgi:acyl carrier protein